MIYEFSAAAAGGAEIAESVESAEGPATKPTPLFSRARRFNIHSTGNMKVSSDGEARWRRNDTAAKKSWRAIRNEAKELRVEDWGVPLELAGRRTGNQWFAKSDGWDDGG